MSQLGDIKDRIHDALADLPQAVGVNGAHVVCSFVLVAECVGTDSQRWLATIGGPGDGPSKWTAAGMHRYGQLSQEKGMIDEDSDIDDD